MACTRGLIELLRSIACVETGINKTQWNKSNKSKQKNTKITSECRINPAKPLHTTRWHVLFVCSFFAHFFFDAVVLCLRALPGSGL